MPGESIAAKAARGAGWVFAWRMATRLLGLGSTLVLVRFLQPGDFGLVAIAVAFAGGIDALSSIGTEYALIREHAPDRALYDTAFTMNLLRGVLTVLIVVAAAWPMASFLNEPRLVPLMLVLSVAMMLSAVENIGTVEFRRDFAFDKEFQLFLLPRVLGVISNVVLAFLWPSYWVLVIGTLLTRGSRMVLSYVIHPYRPRLTLSEWRPLFGFSFWIWAQSVVAMIRDRGDPVLIGRFTDPTGVGTFSIGQEIAWLPSTEMVEPISRTLFPGFAAAVRSGVGMADAYLRAMAVICTMVLPACFGMSLLGDPVVRLMLGAKWLAAIPVVQVLGIVGAVSVIVHAALNVLGVAGNTRMQFILVALGLVLRVPLLAFLAWRHQLVGAAYALAVSGAVDVTAAAVVVARYLRLGIADHVRVFWRPMVATAAMALGLTLSGLGWSAVEGANPVLILHILLTAALGAVLYLAALALAWMAAGRPAGAEIFLFALGMSVLRRGVRLVR